MELISTEPGEAGQLLQYLVTEIKMIAVWFPTVDQRWLILRRYTQPSLDTKLLKCTTLRGFLSPWRRFFGLGLHADSLIRENARRERGLCLAGFRKRIWLSEKQLLNLRWHRITMVQATESRKGLNLPFTRRANFCRPTCWRVLRESEMRPVPVIMSNPL